jgi:hypothetical protein
VKVGIYLNWFDQTDFYLCKNFTYILKSNYYTISEKNNIEYPNNQNFNKFVSDDKSRNDQFDHMIIYYVIIRQQKVRQIKVR